ncbi:NUDIX hydrolase [SAR116 cluster bacterium]|nr:NUDIX hydrolase [SAR116 cluster bacterium]
MKKPFTGRFSKVFDTPHFTIEQSIVPPFQDRPYYRVVSPNSVIVCLIDNDDRFILVHQLRPNLGYQTIEFPAGMVDGSETAEAAALRELGEETGLAADLIYLGGYRTLMNRTVNLEHVFFGMNVRVIECVNREVDTELVRLERNKFFERVSEGMFEQIAALGVVLLAELALSVDFKTADFATIRASFKAKYRAYSQQS